MESPEEIILEAKHEPETEIRYTAGPGSHLEKDPGYKAMEEAIRGWVLSSSGGRAPETVQVTVWSKMRKDSLTQLLVYNSPLRVVLNNLDEEMNKDGETEPNVEMRRLEKEFICAVVAQYEPVDFEIVKTWSEPFDPKKYGWSENVMAKPEPTPVPFGPGPNS